MHRSDSRDKVSIAVVESRTRSLRHFTNIGERNDRWIKMDAQLIRSTLIGLNAMRVTDTASYLELFSDSPDALITDVRHAGQEQAE
ncbi:hypothetical protein Spa11_19560 [Botrimarina mediterranea]|uniref:Uncharacterized protein n=1 Tax=Botrimarina mediterranea TaxID=2528022 RepID=A0A518K7K5_9BACT|nr:hypothetical protein Spa11_19560 [Botrimarina mediterranea]